MGEPAAADHLDFPKHTTVPLGKSVGEVLGGSFKKGPLEVTSAIPRPQAGCFLSFFQADQLNGMRHSARETEVQGGRGACGDTRGRCGEGGKREGAEDQPAESQL